MVRRSDSALLRCETLEARDVPAVVVDGTFVSLSQPPVPNGGTVALQEVSFARTDTNIMNQAFRGLEPVATRERSATAADRISLSLNGSALTIAASDGIYVRYTNTTGATFFHNRGTTLTIQNVAALSVNLQLGGNDTITDATILGTTLNGGDGNDTIDAAGGGPDFNPVLTPFLQQPGRLPAAFLPLLGGLVPPKVLIGGNGNDFLTVSGSSTFFTLDGGAGDDTINGPDFGTLNTFFGGSGADIITGPTVGFFNSYDGGAGNDTITGGFGPDIISGGIGIDILIGGGGNDFYLALDVDPDVILNQPGDFVASDSYDLRAGG